MWVEVSKIAYEKLIEKEVSVQIEHEKIKQTIAQMHEFQYENFGMLCGRLSTKKLAHIITVSKEVKEFYDAVATQLQISARSYTNILKVALTISLIDNKQEILKEHILEALSYRPQDKFMGI
jgi:magnesium chelatase family protein